MDLVQELALARERNAQLEHALGQERTIERAVGFVMCALEVDSWKAFDLMREHSRRNQAAILGVAADVLDRKLKPAVLACASR